MPENSTTCSELWPVGSAQWNDWRWQATHSLRDPVALCSLLGFSGADTEAVLACTDRYPMCVTPYYLSLADSFDPGDPIIRQCLPTADEVRPFASGEPDPLGEESDAVCARLVHRYPDRALLVATNRCAVHCRHCMRKRKWLQPTRDIADDELEDAVRYLANTPAVREVLFSGGDPLLLPDLRLAEILQRLQEIPSIEMVRIGSRLPVVLPQRFTQDFCDLIGRFPPVWLATHFNHPCELTAATAKAARRLLRAGVPMVNQTVLLRGVNDQPDVIRSLCTGLLRQGIKPYYLFHGDPVAGAMHFRTGIARGLEIMDALRGEMSGLALPAFAIDLPEGGGKVRLQPDCACGEGSFRDFKGGIRVYPDVP